MARIILGNWDLTQFRVWVNLPSPIREVQVPIWHISTPIGGLLYSIRQVQPLISQIRSYPPYHYHVHLYLSLSCLLLQHHGRAESWVIPLYLSMPWSWVDTKYSVHRVQHTPSTAYTEYSSHVRLFVLSLSSGLQVDPESSFSSRRASWHDRLPSTSSRWEPKGKVALSHSHGCK